MGVRPDADDHARSPLPGDCAPAPQPTPSSAGPLDEPGARRRRRILFVSPQPFYEDRGSPIAVRRVLEALSELGESVDLLTLPVGEPVGLPGLRILRVGTKLRLRHISVGFSLRKVLLNCLLAAAVVQRLRREDYGCLHAVEEAAIVATVAGKLFKIPVLYDMHSSLPEQLTKHRLFRPRAVQKVLHACERWLFRNAEIVVCSAGLGSYVRSIDPAARVHEWMFPSAPVASSAGCAAQLRARHGLPDGAPIVLYSGTFEAYQGLSLLIEAAANVHARMPEVVFLLIGASATSDLDAPQAPWLRVIRRRPQAEVAPYLALADVLVSPRVHGRNLPLKIFDYMAAGKPIVATEGEAHRTVLSESRARLVQPEPAALADAIVELLTRTEIADRLGRAAQAYAKAHCMPDNFIASVDQIYGQVWMRTGDQAVDSTGALGGSSATGRRSPRKAPDAGAPEPARDS